MLTRDERKALHDAEYLRRFEKAEVAQRLERLIDRMDLRPDALLADLGCGNGAILPLIAHRVGQYYGVDFSEDFIEAAQRKQAELGITNARFWCGDIQAFCRNHQAAIDHALCLDLSEHVYDDEWANILKSIHDCLKPGGTLFLHTPNADFLVERMKARGILKQFPEHIAVRNARQNLALLREAGFSHSRAHSIAHYNSLRFIHPLSRLPGIGSLFRARLFIEAHK
jgi:SAM-dependent methyltransferase